MTPRWPLFATIALTLMACQGGAPPFVGKPHIAGTSGNKTAGKTPSPTPADSSAPSAAPSSGSLASQEPPPVPVGSAGAGGGGTGGTTPAASGSPVLSLVTGTQSADTWQAGIPMQRARAGLVAAALADQLVAFEGANSPSLESFTPGELGWALDTRHDLADRPADPDKALRDGRTLQVLGIGTNVVFGAGGSDGLGVLGTIGRYTTDGFTGEAAFMGANVKAAAGGLVGDVLIVAGGLGTAGAIVPTTQRLSIGSGTASLGAAMPNPVAGAASAVIGGKVYMVGGYTLDGSGAPVATTAVQVYDVGTNTWRRTGDGGTTPPAALPDARHSGAACTLDGKLYLAGGVGATGSTLSSLIVYDPVANTWTTKAAMVTPRALLALAAYQGKVWALGGYDPAGKPLASVETYQP